jgi:hypothetical protein
VFRIRWRVAPAGSLLLVQSATSDAISLVHDSQFNQAGLYGGSGSPGVRQLTGHLFEKGGVPVRNPLPYRGAIGLSSII